MPDGQVPFYERPRWQAAAAVVALVGAIWAVIGAPTPWRIVKDVTAEKLPASNTMLVLDTSKAMARPFASNTTRLEAAQRAVERFTVPLKNEGLALRTFGGSCEKSGRVVVDFAAEHGDEVRDASADLRPRGRSNLVNAVRAAIDDFADDDRFPEDAAQRIVVFMGSVDECHGAAAARDIRNDIKHSGVDATFKFVALKLGRKSRQRLLRFERALGRRAETAFADDNPELATADKWLMREPRGAFDCADDVDNDGDNQIDRADPECEAGGTEAPEQPAGECDDEIDNDSDGTVDGNDPECASGTTEAPREPADECNDEIDNDSDGLRDHLDPGCAVDGMEASG